jgi:hypothetical protein
MKGKEENESTSPDRA